MATFSSCSSRWRRASKSARAIKIDYGRMCRASGPAADVTSATTLSHSRISMRNFLNKPATSKSRDLRFQISPFSQSLAQWETQLVGEEPVWPLCAGGSQEFVWCLAWAQQQHNYTAWNLVKYMRVEPAHGPTGSNSRRDRPQTHGHLAPSCCARALFSCLTGVLELDLTNAKFYEFILAPGNAYRDGPCSETGSPRDTELEYRMSNKRS